MSFAATLTIRRLEEMGKIISEMDWSITSTISSAISPLNFTQLGIKKLITAYYEEDKSSYKFMIVWSDRDE